MANDTVEIKITGDSSDLSAALKDVADRLELLHQALAGTAGKFTDVGKDAEKGMGKVKASSQGAAKAVKEWDQQVVGASSSGKKLSESGDKIDLSFKGLMKTVDKLSDSVDKYAADQAKNLTKNLESAADRAGRADSALSAFGSVLDNVNPQMAELTRQAADVAGMTEQMILAFTQAPGAVIAITATIALYELSISSLREEAEKIEKKNIEVGETYDKLGQAMQRSADASRDVQQQLKILRGEETALSIQLQERIDEEEKRHNKVMRNIDKNIKRRAKGREQDAQIFMQLMTEGTERRAAEEEDHKSRLQAIQDLFDIKQASLDAAEAVSDLAKAQSEAFNASMSIGVDTLSVYVLEMNKFERALDGTSASMQKAAGMFVLGRTELSDLNVKFVKSEIAAGRTGTVTENASKQAKSAIDLLNKSYRDRLGVEQDLLFTSRLGNKIYGALNITTGQTLDLQELLNAALAENLRIERDRARQQAERAAAIKAFVDERQRLIDSLEDENDAIEARLEGPAAELTNAYQKEIELLDETIEKYDRGSKTGETSARLIALAEEQKILKTKEYEAALDEIIAKLNEQSEKQEEVSQDAAESLEKLVAVSEGAMGDEEQQHNRALSLLSERMEEQKQLVEDYYQEAIERGADSVESEKLRAEEMLQIEQEYQEKRDALDKEYTDAQRRRRVESIEMFGTASATLLQSTSDVLMAISQNADQLNEEQKKKMFYLSQAAAIGEVAISGIVAIANIWEEHAANPIFATALSAGMAGITAAQMSNLAAQKPSFDIGGVIKGGVMASSADQIGVNVLPGESVLNRSATERLGEQGVNNLNAGKGMGQEVIVVPSYRHFDRFIKDEYRKGGTLRRLFNDAREYPIGHRSY